MADFAVRDGYAFYRGPSAENTPHRHAAFQIAIAGQGTAGDVTGVSMVDARGVRHRAVALIVPPMVRHRLVPTPRLLTFFVEPHCAFADRLRARCGDGITAAPELRGLGEADVRGDGVRPSAGLDPRLLKAMEELAGSGVPMPVLAARLGLSPQRLRALAQHQLGMPLVRWRLWKRLARAVEALRAGQSPAAAALTAGFADQAHFTRQMREMVGLTPSSVLPVLRRSDPAGDVDRDGAGDR